MTAASMNGPQQGANGSAGTVATPAPAQSAGPGEGAQPSSDYLGRVRAGGDFATQEVRNHQSRADRLEAENRALKERFGGKLSTYVERAGADTVTRIVERFEAGLSDPQTAAAVKGWYETGQLPIRAGQRAAQATTAEPSGEPGGDDLDDYDPVARRLKALESRLDTTLARLETGLGATIQSTGKAAVENHLRRFRSDFHLTDAEFQRVADGMLRQVDQWSANPDGRAIVQRIADPTAYESVRTLAMGFVPQEALEQLGERKRLQARNRSQGFATDVPSGAATTGAEPPADLASRPAGEVLAFFRANPHMLPPE